jgi:hypothetical protein
MVRGVLLVAGAACWGAWLVCCLGAVELGTSQQVGSFWQHFLLCAGRWWNELQCWLVGQLSSALL